MTSRCISHILPVHAIVPDGVGVPDTNTSLFYRNSQLIYAVETTPLRGSWVECVRAIWFTIAG